MSREPIPDALLERTVEELQIMGQVVRLRLIECLAQGEATPGELADELGLTQQNVSQHLQVLYKGSILRRRRDGTTVLYCLADEGPLRLLDQMVAWVSSQIAELSRRALPEAEPEPPHVERTSEDPSPDTPDA